MLIKNYCYCAVVCYGHGMLLAPNFGLPGITKQQI